MKIRFALLAWLISIFGLASAGPARADYAPVDQPGPPLTVPTAQLQAALSCWGQTAGSAREPILLVPGTTVNPQADFGWSWEPQLQAMGWPYCTVELPGNAMGDIQIAGQYVVFAIRAMHASSGQRVEIVGHSQGGMVPRWALRFWPDTRNMVDDLIGLSASNHGTIDANTLCLLTCAPAIWQQRSNAAFIAALNSIQETFPGISYTEIYTNTDEVVVPNFGPAASSSVHGGGGAITNVPIQQVCPLDLTEHLGVGIYDNTAFQIALDALTHAGPADPSRVPRSICLQPLMPGVNLVAFPFNYASTLQTVATTLATYPHTPSEPPLACYVTASCPSGQGAARARG
jgi:hypothetical protein